MTVFISDKINQRAWKSKTAIAVGAEKGREKVIASPTWTSVMFLASGQRSEGLGCPLTNVVVLRCPFCFSGMYII